MNKRLCSRLHFMLKQTHRIVQNEKKAGIHLSAGEEPFCVPFTETEYGEFCAFEVLTLCPIEREAIVPKMLTEAEREWLNAYHRRVYEEIGPRVAPEVKGWLMEVTEEI